MFDTHKLGPAIVMTLVVALTGALLASLASPTNAAVEPQITGEPLELKITGVRNNQGSVVVMVFDDEKAWNTEDYDAVIDVREIQATTEDITMSFANLTEGPYAVSLWHDENTDGEFNMEYGFPTEGWSITGAKSMYDEPAWNEARVNSGKVNLNVFYVE